MTKRGRKSLFSQLSSKSSVLLLTAGREYTEVNRHFVLTGKHHLATDHGYNGKEIIKNTLPASHQIMPTFNAASKRNKWYHHVQRFSSLIASKYTGINLLF